MENEKSIQDVKLSFICSESWDKMKPANNGRHCDVCNKTVIDFTNKTQGEYLQIVEESNGKLCGRFKAQQTVHMPQFSFDKAAAIAIAATGLSLLSTDVNAQKTMGKPVMGKKMPPKENIRGEVDRRDTIKKAPVICEQTIDDWRNHVKVGDIAWPPPPPVDTLPDTIGRKTQPNIEMLGGPKIAPPDTGAKYIWEQNPEVIQILGDTALQYPPFRIDTFFTIVTQVSGGIGAYEPTIVPIEITDIMVLGGFGMPDTTITIPEIVMGGTSPLVEDTAATPADTTITEDKVDFNFPEPVPNPDDRDTNNDKATLPQPLQPNISPPIEASPAIFPGGDAALNKFIFENMRWPVKLGESVTVFVQVHIDKTGLVVNSTMLSPYRADVDAEAMRLANLMQFIPAVNVNGAAVESVKSFPVNFIAKE